MTAVSVVFVLNVAFIARFLRRIRDQDECECDDASQSLHVSEQLRLARWLALAAAALFLSTLPFAGLSFPALGLGLGTGVLLGLCRIAGWLHRSQISEPISGIGMLLLLFVVLPFLFPRAQFATANALQLQFIADFYAGHFFTLWLSTGWILRRLQLVEAPPPPAP